MEFVEHLKKYLTNEEINKLLDSFNKKEQKGIILNEQKMSKETLKKLFPNIVSQNIVPNCYLYDKDEYDLGKKIYHELGAYYIQDPSASLVSYFLNPKKNQKVLDLCAAPGGKSVGASILMQNKGIIYANDLSRSRAEILLSNVERMGLGNVVVLSKDFKHIYQNFNEYFDSIILDAPCSGSGMFRRSDDMKEDWTYEKVLRNAQTQKELILMCYSMLKKGGTLMYSTCSYSFEEDEEVIEYLLNNTDAKLENIPSFDGEYRSKRYPETVHLFPFLFKGEGHYIAKIRKSGNLKDNLEDDIIISRKSLSKGNKPQIDKFRLFVEPSQLLLSMSIRPGLYEEYMLGKESIPAHHFSHFSNAINSIELNKEEVIKYLKGESLYKKDIPNGYHFVSFLNMNLGVIHSVNGTLKNLYPKGLRISAHINDCF